jgi:hypothetical protein
MPETVMEWIGKRSGFSGSLAYAAASSADDIYELLEVGRDEKMRGWGSKRLPWMVDWSCTETTVEYSGA